MYVQHELIDNPALFQQSPQHILLEVQTARIASHGPIHGLRYGPFLYQLKVCCPDSIMAIATAGAPQQTALLSVLLTTHIANQT